MNTKDNWQTTATIHDQNRRAIWGTIFENATVPIRSIQPVRAELPGYPEAQIYLLDLAAITEEQLQQIIQTVCQLFNLEEEEVRRDIAERGVPILADGVSVASTDQGMLYSLMDEEDHDARMS